MARLLMLLMFMALVVTGSLAVKSCSDRPSPPTTSAHVDDSALVALRDGSTMIAQNGTVGRALIDWLATKQAGQKSFELGGQEFVGRTATPTSQSIGRVSRLVAMLRANPDVHVTIIGHSDSSGDDDADRALGLQRAEVLAQLLREGGILNILIAVQTKGSADPIASNDTLPGRARNQRVSLILSRKE